MAEVAAVAKITEMTTLLRQKSHRRYGTASYIPAFSYDFLTPFYDLMMKYAARESSFKPEIVKQAGIGDRATVLDVGCGTATLTILIKKTHQNAHVTGIDADPRILEVAKRKAANANADIILEHGSATDLPYADNSFDHVFSSMALHHLAHEDKIRALNEVFRVLKAGGQLHIADFARPHNAVTYLESLLVEHLEETSDNFRGFIPSMIRKAGFVQLQETVKHTTFVGTIALYKAVKPLKPLQGANIKEHHIVASGENARYYSTVRRYMRLLAPFYDTGTFPISSLRNQVADLTDVRKGSRILDVGTGTGKQAFAFAKKGFNVTGIDLSQDMIKVAQKKNHNENAGFQVGDATSLPFEDNAFDVTTVSFALHDMITVERKKAVEEMTRVTKPHGTIVVVDYALPRNRILRQLVFNFVRLYELYYPEFIRSNLKGLLNDSGINVTEELSALLGAARIIKGIKRD